jgi:L-amino acid N-acyltransferase YncA
MTDVIRRATETDASAIAQVHVAAWRTTYRGIVAQDHIDGLSVDDFTARWQSRLSGRTAAPHTVLVASDNDGNIVGFASGGPTRETGLPFDAELYAIYLLQPFQARGLGRQLLRELAKHLLEEGHSSLCVSVLSDNPARHFYQRMGGHLVRTAPHVMGGRSYPASWFGWFDLRDLANV